jgi:hypothetical protein
LQLNDTVWLKADLLRYSQDLHLFLSTRKAVVRLLQLCDVAADANQLVTLRTKAFTGKIPLPARLKDAIDRIALFARLSKYHRNAFRESTTKTDQ